MRFFFSGRYADVVEIDRGQNGYFGVRPHPSELTNGANLTDYGRNGFGVKKNWLSGLDVRSNFLVACVSNAFFLMARMSNVVCVGWNKMGYCGPCKTRKELASVRVALMGLYNPNSFF
jgi:hypothetical protein